jgi:hypothetical protein
MKQLEAIDTVIIAETPVSETFSRIYNREYERFIVSSTKAASQLRIMGIFDNTSQ